MAGRTGRFVPRTGRQRRDVTGGAADRHEHALAVEDRRVDRSARDRREKLHERFEVVNAAPSGERIADVFRIRPRVAARHVRAGDAVGGRDVAEPGRLR